MGNLIGRRNRMARKSLSLLHAWSPKSEFFESLTANQPLTESSLNLPSIKASLWISSLMAIITKPWQLMLLGSKHSIRQVVNRIVDCKGI